MEHPELPPAPNSPADAAAPANAATVAALTLRVAELERLVTLLARGNAIAATPPVVVPLPPPVPSPSPLILETPGAAGSTPMFSASPRPSAPANSAAPANSKSLESRLGAQVFNLVGILALVIATAYGLKLAIEHGYLGPVARVLLGIAAGVGVVLFSEQLRRKGMAAYSYSLKAVGSAVLYLTLWAGFQLYHLLPASVALTAMILVTAWNAFMAWSQDSELLAAYALAGGFLTPLLLSTGSNHEGFLFTYLFALDAALVLLLRTRPWRRLLLPAYLITAGYYIGWYNTFYNAGAASQPFTETLLFVLLFLVLFATISIRGWIETADTTPEPKPNSQPATDIIVPVLIPLLNAAFTGISLFSLFNDSGLRADKPWLMVALAAVYLLLTRVQRSAVASAMHLAMGVIFLTVAIPLKASGHSLTTAWLVEGLVLFWASTRFELEERAASRVLWILSAGGYLLGLGSLLAHWFVGSIFGMEGFFNRDLAAALVAIATLAGGVLLSVRDRDRDQHPSRGGPTLMVTGGLIALAGVAVLLCFRELASTWADQGRHEAFLNASFATALVGLAVLAAVAWSAWRLHVLDPIRYEAQRTLAGAFVIAFNLLTILSIEREIGAFWHRDDANLQRSLAISGFLMAYGAMLLTIGFVKRSAFTRWQALVLLLFTISKVFLYDISGLSAGYRVASFMGLGAVLMAISYAYQKDWLGLKTDPIPAAPPQTLQTPQETEPPA